MKEIKIKTDTVNIDGTEITTKEFKLVDETELIAKASVGDRFDVVDETDYDPRFCLTGGKYSFTTVYEKVAADKWEVFYYTSADFGYCSYCGSFGCDGDECEPQFVGDGKLLQIIGEAADTDGWYVEYCPKEG